MKRTLLFDASLVALAIVCLCVSTACTTRCQVDDDPSSPVACDQFTNENRDLSELFEGRD